MGSVNHALTVYLCLYRHRSANMIQPVAMVSCDYAHVQVVVTLECLDHYILCWHTSALDHRKKMKGKAKNVHTSAAYFDPISIIDLWKVNPLGLFKSNFLVSGS